ncbi:MAG: T9SS type A sorting domain-containing protein, partial [Candidatus Eisenbacteria bacterium]|nr:T9SS type A sorting domain-containing protein [Candidatus Eisenbacteria bacterium]
LPASTRARLEFAGLPEGASVRSCNGFDSRLQRGIGAPVVTAESRRMSVAWPVTGDAADSWAIERRVDDGEWQPFETRSADADHVLRVVDTRVTPGHSYAYRTGWSDEYGNYASPVATSQPVSPPGFAFEGVTPNPSTGVFSARIEIPEAGSVQLDVLDVAGRVIASQKRWLAAGRYTEPLAHRGAVAPGVYTVRMTYRGLVSWSRVVVLR